MHTTEWENSINKLKGVWEGESTLFAQMGAARKKGG